MASYLHRTAQPSTLATFRSWGSSIGAGRIRLAGAKIRDICGIWRLQSGDWSLESGVKSQESEITALDSRLLTHDPELPTKIQSPAFLFLN